MYGVKPSKPEGKYFRNTIWSWPKLWDLVCCVCGDVLTDEDKRLGQFNDGHLIDDAKATTIAARLDDLLTSGKITALADWYQQHLKWLPDEDCTTCGGTGKRKPVPHTGPGDEPCNGCQSTGKVRPFATHYRFTEENVREFATFAGVSGGFEIH